MSPLDLIGRVAARRLRNSTEADQGRAFLCIMGLQAPIVTAIARHVAAETAPGGHVEVFVHPSLVDGEVGSAVVSDKTAPWHRNHAKPGVRLTLCTVPADQVKAIGPTLAHNEKVDDAWLLQDPEVWAQISFDQSSDEIQEMMAVALSGLLRARVAHDAYTVATYLDRVATAVARAGDEPERALRSALPALRLSRDAGDRAAKLTSSVAVSATFFGKVLEETQPPLYLKSRDGDPLNRNELQKRLKALADERRLTPDAVAALGELLRDRTIYDGSWTSSQAAVAELGWEAVEPFFSDASRKVKPSFGAETRQLFDRQFPTSLTDEEKELLDDLTKDSRKSNEQIDDFFSRHRARLQTDARLYKRWERLVFQAPIEVKDLTEGLLKLAHRAAPQNEEADDDAPERVLVIRLRNAEKFDFWARDKNTRVLRYLRDRFRGLSRLLEPHAILDCGRCWAEDWDRQKEDVISTSRSAVELEFEAFLVPTAEAAAVLAARDGRPHPNRAQLIWRPPPEAIGLSAGTDLRLIRPPEERVRLLTGRVRQNRAARTALATGLDLAQRTSINDVFGESEGLLAHVGAQENRIDLTWPLALREIAEDRVITPANAEAIGLAFVAFRDAYSLALHDFLYSEAGVGAASLLTQAERYGELLTLVQAKAPQPICLRRLLAPLVSIGVIGVDGEPPAAIVTSWHPLRLAELCAKTRQLAADIGKVVSSRPEQRADIGDFVMDRAKHLGATFYGDVGALPGEHPRLLAETQALLDCSLLEGVTELSDRGISGEPAEAAVVAFNRVADEYLTLRPHEEANFSTVILNADTENLPLAMANGLAQRIDENPELRCELVVTDDDPVRLRQVYERQNRRISLELDAALASEAARNFLSRLRLSIQTPETLSREAGLKASDIVLLQDVVARNSQLRWLKTEPPAEPPSLADCTPSERSKRRPFRKGDTSSALYLTAPHQPSAAQAYLNALYAVTTQEAAPEGVLRLPVQEVEFQSGDVARVMRTAHQIGLWVMTFDRVADRRLVTTDERRIIRYFSAPGDTHNVIVSTEIGEGELGDFVQAHLTTLLPSHTVGELSGLRRQLFRRAAQLSGGVVMRGVQWSNYAQELLGLVLSQRELERYLAQDGENRTGWFFLDDYRDFLDLTGEMADILGIDFYAGPNGPEIRLVLAEAKYAGRDALVEHRKRSVRQLESTFTALSHRLLNAGTSLDPAIWRHRLADMVLEHMEPFDQVGGWTQDHWLESLRQGSVPFRLEGHSMVFSHDLDAVHEPMPVLPDEIRSATARRQMAQWVFARPSTAQAVRDLENDASAPLISRPSGWPPLSDVSHDTASAPSAAGLPADAAVVESHGFAGEPAREPVAPLTNDQALVTAEAATSGSEAAALDVSVPPEPSTAGEPSAPVEAANDLTLPKGPWSPQIHAVLTRLSRARDEAEGEAWLAEQIKALRSALQVEGMDAPVTDSRLTPNTGLVYVAGRTLTVGWLEKKQTDLLTRYGLDIVRITPMAGRIAIGLRRPTRAILHLADAWLRRDRFGQDPAQKMAPLLGEKEDDGDLCFLPLANGFAGQDTAAPHSLISGTTGSGKGILVTNLILDLCGLNSPEELELHLIDPKRGVDYAWARRLPHLKHGIIDDQAEALALLSRLVEEMDERYDEIAAEGCRNIDHYNRKVPAHRRMPRIVIVFDEVANWMQDDEFKGVVDGLINKIATKSRAAGFHLFMIYQRADNQVMTMQLRTNLGNKLILRLGDEGSSKIALNERGAERLLGKGHLIAKLGSDDKIYMQVPYIGDDEVEELAKAVIASWGDSGRRAAE